MSGEIDEVLADHVFEIHSDCARSHHRFRRRDRISVTRLDVRSDRHFDGADDTGDDRDVLVTRDVVAVGVAEGIRHSCAGRADGGEAGDFENASGSGVPGIGKDQDVWPVVKLAEVYGFWAWVINYQPGCSPLFCSSSHFCSGAK